MEIVGKLFEYISGTVDVFNSYYEILEKTGFSGVNPYLSEFIVSSLSSIESDTKTKVKNVPHHMVFPAS